MKFMNNMRILVVGSGALGLYYGGRLAVAGHAVYFLARSENLLALRSAGLRVTSIHGDFSLPHPLTVESPLAAAQMEPFDLLLVTLKTYQTTPEILGPLASAISASGTVLTLQNGVESTLPLFHAFGKARVLGGIAFIGAERIAPGKVDHTAAGHIVIGEPDGGVSSRSSGLAELFKGAGIQATASADIRREQWRKLVWNAPFNGMTALTGALAHETLQTPAGRAMVLGAMLEVIAVARALGVELGVDVAEQTLAITEQSGPVRTSMLVDRLQGRRLEIDSIYGPVVREGQRLGIPTPILSNIYALLQSINLKR